MDSLRECLDTIKEDIVSRKSSIEYLEVVVTTDLLIATDKPQVCKRIAVKYLARLQTNII